MPHPEHEPALPLPGPEDVAAAHARIARSVHRTPALTSRHLDQAVSARHGGTGTRLHLKAENLQRTGAFKIRGAMNALLQLDGAARSAGVIAYSSGNHAQAIACAAGELGIPAVVVMPRDAPGSKRAATAGYGAEILLYDPLTERREEIASALAAERGLTLIPPFDHPHIIAGQGTAARELLQDVPDLDVLLMPLGGGGLLAGTLLAALEARPGLRVYGVEPEAGDDVQQSLRTGERVHIDVPSTIADGARTRQVGALTFPIIREHVADVLTVGDEALRRTMRWAATRMKILVEPTGALGLAAAMHGARGLHGELDLAGRNVGAILSGGNTDLSLLAEEPRG